MVLRHGAVILPVPVGGVAVEGRRSGMRDPCGGDNARRLVHVLSPAENRGELRRVRHSGTIGQQHRVVQSNHTGFRFHARCDGGRRAGRVGNLLIGTVRLQIRKTSFFTIKFHTAL